MATKFSTRFGQTGRKKLTKVLHEYATGKLRTPNGTRVSDRKQAIAIALSEARRSEGR